jgi:hypothetical protein
MAIASREMAFCSVTQLVARAVSSIGNNLRISVVNAATA